MKKISKRERLAETVSGGKSKGENLKSFMDEAREAAKDPENIKNSRKKLCLKVKGFHLNNPFLSQGEFN